MFSQIKLAAFGIAALAVVTAIGLGYWHYTSLVNERDTLRTSNAILETVVQQKDAAIAEVISTIQLWADAATRNADAIEQLAVSQHEATNEQRRLNAIFSRHDLGRLAIARPGLIQRRINSGTGDALRMLIDATDLRRDRTVGSPETRTPNPPDTPTD